MQNQGYALMGGYDQDAAAFGGGGMVGGYPVIVGATPGAGPNPRLVEQQYTQERGLLMPFPSTTVATASTGTATANPQVPFRPSSLAVTATAAASLNITDIRVGKNSQTVASGPMPAAAFGVLATYKGLKLDTAGPGINVDVDYQDTGSGADNVIVSMMYGVAAQ